MAKLVDSGNNQYGIRGSFTWVVADGTGDHRYEEFPFSHNIWVHLGIDRTSGSVTPRIELYMNDRWFTFYGITNGTGLSATSGVVNAGAVDNRVNRANVMQGNPVPFHPPIPARLAFNHINFRGTITYEVRW